MIITISGMPGSGKSTVAKEIAKRLGCNFYSIGDLRGKMASEKGLTIDELNEIGKTEAWTDKEVDDYQLELGKKEDDFIIDGWLSFHFIPHSIKIFLKVNPEEAAKRVFQNQREDEEHKETVEDVQYMLQRRAEESKQRYLKYYGMDYQDLSSYDLVIDTTNMAIEEVLKKIFTFLTQNNRTKGF